MLDLSETRPISIDRRVRPSLNSCLSIGVIALSLLPLALFVFSLMGRYFFLAELINNFRCQIMLLLFPFFLMLLLLRQWWLTLLFAFATGWSTIGIVWVYLPDVQPPAGPQPIKIMSFNVLVDNPQPQLALQRILETDADVVLVVEYANDWSEVLKGLDEKYPFQVLEPRWHGFGIAFYSKYPLTQTQVYPLSENHLDNPMLITQVTIGEQKIRLAGLHVLSPMNRTRMKVRNQQLREASEILGSTDVPTIVMGDFNCTPWSPFLNDFLRTTGYRDSRQGFGYQATWHRDFGLFKIPIDNAFVSDRIHVHDRWVAEPAGSDHLPIVFEVSVKN